MKNISIMINTNDNRTQALGYDPSLYENEVKRNADIEADMARVGALDSLAVITVTSWDNKKSESKTYTNVDDFLLELKEEK